MPALAIRPVVRIYWFRLVLLGQHARIIQIDEPAIREGLPLRKAEWRAYLDWAVESSRLASSGVADETQFTLTCATRSSTTSSTRSVRSTPT